MSILYRTALGQDSHRFPSSWGTDASDGLPISEISSGEPLRIAGINLPSAPKLVANSDGDVVLHAITNAISGITCKNILGRRADTLCRQGVTDSRAYLKLAISDLEEMQNLSLVHLSLSIEAKRPKFSPHIDAMRASIADLLGLPSSSIGITATTGEGLSGQGRGEGIAVLCVLTVAEHVDDQ